MSIKTILLSLIFTCLLAVFLPAQSRTVKGNYCGSMFGDKSGAFAFRVKTKIMIFKIGLFDDNNIRVTRFDANKLEVGDEFILKYLITKEKGRVLKSITGTGKRENVAPCYLD